MSLDDFKDAFSGATSSQQSDDSDLFSTAAGKHLEDGGYGRQRGGIAPDPRPLRRASTTSNASRFSMRIPIRVQLALLVLFTSMLALAVISIATWVYTWNFVANIEMEGLTLTASLKAAQVASDLQLIQSTCATIVTRLLIQQALMTYYAGNTTGTNWSRAIVDVQSALSSGGYSNLLQVIIYPRNNTAQDNGLLNVTASLSSPIALPYNYTNGSAVYLGDPGVGYPARLYPNFTYVDNIPNDPFPTVYAFPDVEFLQNTSLLLGPMQVNATFAMLSLTLPIINTTSTTTLGYMSIVADASAITNVLGSREGLGDTGDSLLIGPASPNNQFPISENTTDRTQLSNTLVRYVFPPDILQGQSNRHSAYNEIGGPSFPLSAYSTALDAFDTTTTNNSADLSTTNEQGAKVAVGWARPDTSLADWILLVEQGHSEAWAPVTRLRNILLACVFGTIGFIMLLILPMAYFSVLPIARLKEATLTSVAPVGVPDDRSSEGSGEYVDEDGVAVDEETARNLSPGAKKKGGFMIRMRDMTRGRRRPSRAERVENARRRAFKIPAKVQDRKHWITDELTELTGTFNEMSDELTMQYSRLEERVADRTRELEISKKAAEAANESKTLFIANISHELKTPLNGILGMAAVCMGETDIDKIKSSLQVVYKSGDLLLHLLNDLLTFSKNQIGQSLSLEEKEFALCDVKSQLVHIFDKQVREGRIVFSVNFIGTDMLNDMDDEAHSPSRQTSPEQKGKVAPALGPTGTGRLKDMRLWGDQHRILQVIINLVSNSLKFTPEHGNVEVRIRCLGEVEVSPSQSSGLATNRNSIGSKRGSQTGSQTRVSRTRDRRTDSSTGSVASRVASSQRAPRSMGTALLINPMDPRAAQMHIQVRERAPTPPPANARTLQFEFEVEDTGPGMSPALQERVFEPFVQGDLGLNRKFGGTGLGLAICSQLAGLMGGDISLKSTEGVGSTFTMRIPLKFVKERASSTASSNQTPSRTPSISLPAPDNAVSQGRRSLESPPKLSLNSAPSPEDVNLRLIGLSQPFFAASPTMGVATTRPITETSKSTSKQLAALDRISAAKDGAPGNKIRVLVAEDNLVNQEVVLRMLKLEAIYDVTVAKDGQEAFDMVKASMESGQVFNLIFMDIQMPNLDGLQSTRMIRKMGYSAPIVALTAFAEESNVQECIDSGMDMFLSKPIRRPALKQVLKKFAPIPEESDDTLLAGNGADKRKPDSGP